VIKVLVGNGANVNPKTHDSVTPLDIIREEKLKVLLIGYGAKSGLDVK
jgi:hypothetical protein